MKTELQKLQDRVTLLKDNLYGVGNWKKSNLPTTIEGCKFYISYCKKEFNIIG